MNAVKTHDSRPSASCRARGSSFSTEEREQLILEHLPQVRRIARHIHSRLPWSVSLDDLVSTGVVGLIAAIDRFDRSQNAKLVTYAEFKIRGAILDSLRGLDCASRQQRTRGKKIRAAISEAERRLSRAPSDGEIAAQLGQTVEQYRDWRADLPQQSAGSIEELRSSSSLRVESGELKVLLRVAISELPNSERAVLHLHCYEEMKTCEIAQALGVSSGRISQLKSQAIVRLCSRGASTSERRAASVQ